MYQYRGLNTDDEKANEILLNDIDKEMRTGKWV